MRFHLHFVGLHRIRDVIWLTCCTTFSFGIEPFEIYKLQAHFQFGSLHWETNFDVILVGNVLHKPKAIKFACAEIRLIFATNCFSLAMPKMWGDQIGFEATDLQWLSYWPLSQNVTLIRCIALCMCFILCPTISYSYIRIFHSDLSETTFDFRIGMPQNKPIADLTPIYLHCLTILWNPISIQANLYHFHGNDVSFVSVNAAFHR